MMTNPHHICLRNANSLIRADISCWLCERGMSSFYCFGIDQMENLFILLVVVDFSPTHSVDENKFMQQDSAHNQGLCIKCIYKKRLPWRMFLLVVAISFHILKAHLKLQTSSQDLTAVLMVGSNG